MCTDLKGRVIIKGHFLGELEISASPEKDFNFCVLHVSLTFQEMGKMLFNIYFLGPHAKAGLER